MERVLREDPAYWSRKPGKQLTVVDKWFLIVLVLLTMLGNEALAELSPWLAAGISVVLIAAALLLRLKRWALLFLLLGPATMSVVAPAPAAVKDYSTGRAGSGKSRILGCHLHKHLPSSWIRRLDADSTEGGQRDSNANLTIG